MDNLKLFKTSSSQEEYINGGSVTYPTLQYNQEINKIYVKLSEPIVFWFDEYIGEEPYTCTYTLKKSITWEELINNYYNYFENDFGCNNFHKNYGDDGYDTLNADDTREEIYYIWCDGRWSHIGGVDNCFGTARLGVIEDSDGNIVKKNDLIKSGNYTHVNLQDEMNKPNSWE